jgi:hypothetical protein
MTQCSQLGPLGTLAKANAVGPAAAAAPLSGINFSGYITYDMASTGSFSCIPAGHFVNCHAAFSVLPAEICKQSAPQNWTFHSKLDSGNYDIARLSGLDGTWSQAVSACAANPYCQAVNTAGYLKYFVRPRAEWGASFSDPCQGLFVRQGEHSCRPGLVWLIAQSAAQMWKLHKGSLCLITMLASVDLGHPILQEPLAAV